MTLFSIGTAAMLCMALFGLPFYVFVLGFIAMNAGVMIEMHHDH